VRIAHHDCRTHHDRWHCAIWRRHDPEAHVAAVVDVTCGSEACDQAFLNQQVGPVEAQCAEGVIGIEDPSYNPEQWNTAGSGAYGIPQAEGGMASAGPDWQTNPVTQLRWMIAYVKQRWHDFCGAFAQDRAHGWY